MNIQILSLIIYIVPVDHLDHSRFLIWLETKKKIVGLRLKVLRLILTLGILLILPQFSIYYRFDVAFWTKRGSSRR